LADAEQVYYNHIPFAQVRETIKTITALNIFISCIKCFKYAQVEPTMNALVSVIMAAAGDLMFLLVITLILLIAFALMAVKFFGATLYVWCDSGRAITAIFRFITGQFNLVELYEISPFWSLVFYASLIIVVYFVLLSIFLAIIIDSYHRVMRKEMNKAVIQWSLTKGEGRPPPRYVRLYRWLVTLWETFKTCEFMRTGNEAGIDLTQFDDGEYDLSAVEAELNAIYGDPNVKPPKGEWFDVGDTSVPGLCYVADTLSNKALLQRLRQMAAQGTEDLDLVAVAPDEDQIDEEEETQNEARERLRVEYDLLDEICKLYMNMDTQLQPVWVAARFRKLEKDAERAGQKFGTGRFVDIANRASDRASLIEITEHRATSTSRMFELLSANDTLPENADMDLASGVGDKLAADKENNPASAHFSRQQDWT